MFCDDFRSPQFRRGKYLSFILFKLSDGIPELNPTTAFFVVFKVLFLSLSDSVLAFHKFLLAFRVEWCAGSHSHLYTAESTWIV